MDSLDVPAAPAALTPVFGTQRPPRIWKFWGTALWGLFIFAGMFVGQIGVVTWFVLRREGPIDIAASVHVVGGGPDDFALRDHGSARGVGGAVDRDSHLAHAVCRLPRAALALMDRSCDRGYRPDCSGHGVGSAVARNGTRDCPRLYGRGAEFGARRRLAMAAGDGFRRRRADLRRIFFVRGFLYRGWSESFLGPVGGIILSSLVWTALHLQYNWYFFGEVFSIGLLLGYLRYRFNSTWLTVIVHGLNNLAALAQTILLSGQG